MSRGLDLALYEEQFHRLRLLSLKREDLGSAGRKLAELQVPWVGRGGLLLSS